MTRIKICGITNLEDATFIAGQGVDYIGFIFYPESARYIAPEAATRIIQEIRGSWGAQSPCFVGVFVDASVQVVSQIRSQVGLDLVQLHGSETPEQLAVLGRGAFKAIRPESLAAARTSAEYYGATSHDAIHIPQFLLDSYHPTEKGGTGQLADHAIAVWLSAQYRALLAGGLDPVNITRIIQNVHPWGVDVSSGVELVCGGKPLKGRKDPEKVQAFVRAVRSASVRSA
ncbi:MAG: phosphoribosylanthranilate isomerase [Anaerolineales bacterium]|nr:MAG: phosphoribosylanthranilate isomerase [Anaerolineales bacterium]